MFRKLYSWMMEKAAGPSALPVMALVSFVDSSVFPLPPDIMLIPMCLAARKRAFWFAFVCTLASVAGALLGYGIGYFAYETVGKWILSFYGGADKWYGEFHDKFNQYGFWLVMMAGFTPFPFKIMTIVSGMMKLNVPVLLGASFLSRGARFFLWAVLSHFFGEKVHGLVEKHFEAISLGFIVCVIGGFFLIKLFV